MSIRGVVGIVILVLIVAASFFYSRPEGSTPNIPDDSKAQEALQLVQSHPARNAPTLEQAVDQYLRELEAKGTPFHKGDTPTRVGPRNDIPHRDRLIPPT